LRLVEALRFLQTSQNEFPLVIIGVNADISATRYLIAASYRGRETSIEFPGLAPGKRVYGSLRLLDVKPPCSNLAGALVPANFFFARRPEPVVRLPDCATSPEIGNRYRDERLLTSVRA
jgi:hypothetical protein